MFHCQAGRVVRAWLSMWGWIASTGRLALLATLLLALGAQPAQGQTPSPITLEELLASPLYGQGGPVNATIQCDPTGNSTVTFRTSPGNDQASIAIVAPYTATIQTPSGTFNDHGTTHITLFVREDLPGENIFQQLMASDLTAVEPVLPTTKEICKNGGFQNFPALGFKNQGDCVSFVATDGKNEPGKNIPGVP